jgi:hypothetical protein
MIFLRRRGFTVGMFSNMAVGHDDEFAMNASGFAVLSSKHKTCSLIVLTVGKIVGPPMYCLGGLSHEITPAVSIVVARAATTGPKS